MISASSVLALAALAGFANAHGYVASILIGGTNYTGFLPYQDPYYSPVPDRIVRPVYGNGPVTDMSLIDVQCNGYSAGGQIGSSPAPIFATAAAGSTVKLQWTEWPDSHVGPIVTYMAKAPTGTSVTSWLPGTSPVWFKVDQAGFDLATSTWAAIKLISDKSYYSFTIPATLAPGQYIIRHEIIALHSSYTYPGAQSYPSCIQVQVTGSGTVTPSGSKLVAFPGGYTSTTAGLVWPLWNPTNAQSGVFYPIPGPDLYFGGSYYGAPTGSTGATTTTTTKAATTTTTSKATTAITTSKATTTSTTSKAATTTTTAKATTTTATLGTIAAYGQCGGSGYTGATTCVSGYKCVASSTFYSQCVPA